MLLSLLVLVHSLRPRRTLLSSACQFAGIYCPSKILVAAFVVMAAVIVVNVEVGMPVDASGCLCLLGLGGCLWLPVATWVEWLPVVACGYLG